MSEMMNKKMVIGVLILFIWAAYIYAEISNAALIELVGLIVIGSTLFVIAYFLSKNRSYEEYLIKHGYHHIGTPIDIMGWPEYGIGGVHVAAENSEGCYYFTLEGFFFKWIVSRKIDINDQEKSIYMKGQIPPIN